MKYLYLLIFLFAGSVSFGQTSWVKKGGPIGGNVTDVEYYPNTSTVWAIVNYRVYKSTDDGTTWTMPSNTIFDNNSIYDIEISNNTIYFLGYDGLFTSADQGVTVTTASKGLFFNGLKIKRLPVSGGLVILSGQGSPDIYYSTNNGVSWTAGYNAANINTACLTVNAVDQVFTLVLVGGVYRPFRSTDGGASFSEFSTGITAGLNVTSLTSSTTGGIFGVTNTDILSLSGSTWSTIKGGQIADATISSGSPSFLQFTLDGSGMYFIDNLNHKLYNKTVAGAASTWINQATNFPNTPNGTIWPTQPVYAASSKNFPSNSSNIVFGTTYGIIRSSTGGATNTETSAGIAELGASETIATANGSLLLNTFEAGVLRSENSGDTWSRVTTLPISVGTLTNVLFSTIPLEGMVQLVRGNNNLLYRSTDDGTTFNQVTTPVTFFDVIGGDNNRAFGVNGSSIYYSLNSGSSFVATPITVTGSGWPVSYSINNVIIPTSTNLIYLSIFNSTAGGVNQYWKVALTYNGTTSITGATATLMTNPPFTATDLYGANGKLYAYNNSLDQVAVYSGASWSAARSVPNGDFFIPENNGYIFVSENGSPSKINMSKDDGVTFTSTNLSSGIFGYNVNDITVTPQDFVILSIYHNYVYQSKTKVVAPAAPTGLTEVARLANAYVFRWTDNSYNETAFRILRSSDGGTNYSIIGTVGGNDICSTTTLGGRGYFTDNTVTPGATYKYKLRALNEAGETESAVLTPGGAIPATVAQTIPDNRSWSAQNSGVESYGTQTPKIVGIQHQGNGRYVVSDIIANSFTSTNNPQDFYVNSTTSVVGGAAGIGSFYQVMPNGTGTWNGTSTLTLKWLRCEDPTKTETITFTLQASDPAPATPVLQAVITTSSQVELNWASLPYAKNYIIERSTTSASTGFSQIGSNVTYPGTAMVDNAVTVGTTYYYRMKARNANASPLESAYSNVVTIPFKQPNFLVSATTVSSYVSATLGTYWADFDNDGNEDLMTVNGTLDGVALATVTIFKNLGTGNFEVKTVTTDQYAYNFGAVSDIDGDGKMDISIAIAETAQVDFYKGNGDFTFTKFTPLQLGELADVVKGERQGIMWGDINNDGRLDVVLSGEYDALLDDRISVCIQNANGTFTSIHAGDLGDLTADSFSTYWIDYNNDGYIDILVSGESPQLLYKNNANNTFTLISPAESGIALGGFLGLAVADFNNDGFMDIYCGGGESSGSVIYQNDGDGSFTLKDGTSITENAFVVSPVAGDVNNDGLVDLLVAGFFGSPTKIFMNTSTGSTLSFNPITTEKINDARYWHIGAAFADYNKDGFLDVGMGSLKNETSNDGQFVPGENYLFKNNNNTGNWSEIKLIGVSANKNGLGARVSVTAGGKTYTREVANSSTFTSLNSLIQHFGLGSAATITNIQVKWPTTPPFVQTIPNPAINTIITITENADPDAPVFGDLTGLPTSVNKSALAQTLNIPVTDNKAVTGASMFVKSVSGATFVEIPATSIIATGAQFALTASAFDAIGVQYYFTARDAAGNTARTPADPGAYKTLVKYVGTDAQIPAALLGTGGTVTGWKVIAIPFDLGSSNGVQTVFNELTAADPVLTVKNDYRILTYTETPSPAWQDYPDAFNTIDRGVGYFINIKTPVTIVIGDGLVAPSNTRDNLFKISLKQGWNMIGNPYLEPIDWSNVVALNPLLTGTGQIFKKFNGGTYANAIPIAAYEGGFVHADADVQVSIPFKGQVAPGRIEEISFGPGEWLVPIALQQGEITNSFGGVGMHSKASLLFDQLDDINGPRWFEFTEMNFKHPEHTVKNFARDVVPISGDFEWSFEFDSNIPGVATLKWDNESYTIESDLYLYDEATQTPVNMKETNSYSFNASVSQNFKVYYGDNARSKMMPAKVMLGAAYPNPTSNTTTVPFSIPEKNGNGNKLSVRLEVFDVTGRKVSTLANGEFAPGFYHAQWEAQETLGNGIYIYRLLAGDEILTGKVLLKK